ncbi:hypothetical protein CaCOL14_003744 [Colletotrichum acutatum]
MWKTLEKAPRGLHPVYSRLLSQIDDESRIEIAEIVRWMAQAQEPLTTRQLSNALYPDTKHRKEADEAFGRIRDLVTDSYPLMKLTKDKDWNDWDGRPRNKNNNYVVLYHRSIADYLLEINVHDADLDPKIKTFHITPEKTHYKIAKRCLDDLHARFEHLEDIYYRSELNWKLEADRPGFAVWFKYARSHWPTHARLCGEESLKFIKPRHAFFADESTFRTAWWLEYGPKGTFKDRKKMEDHQGSMLGALHSYSDFGLLPMIHTLLEENLNVEGYVNDDRGSHTALAYATQYDQSEAAGLLIRNGASLVNNGQ